MNIEHGHLDQWADPSYEDNVIEHAHEGGDKPHRHKYTHIGGPTPQMRYVPPSLLDRPTTVADWSGQ